MTDWYTLGLNLGVSVTDLDFIKADHVSAKDSLRETFQCVRKQDPFLTWQKVAGALESMKLNSLAHEIKCKFCT